MRHWLIFLVALLFLPGSVFARARVQGNCEQGGVQVLVANGAASSTTAAGVATNWEQSFPSCTVTIYAAGTTTLSTLYSDNAGTAQANPFAADSTGRWFAYIDNGRVDVKLSGGGIATPFTIGDINVYDSLAPTLGYLSVAFSATPSFDANAASTFAMTLTGNVTSSTVLNSTTGRVVEFQLCQDGVGSRTFAWPGTFLRPPTVPSGISQCMNSSFYYDGTNWRQWGLPGDVATHAQPEVHTGAETHSGIETHSNAETHSGAEAHSGIETHAAAETHAANEPFNAGLTVNTNLGTFNAGLTSAGPNTLNGGGTTAGTYTHAQLHTFTSGLTANGLGTFNAGVSTNVVTSQGSNPAGAGYVRMTNTQSTCWRNQANTGDQCLGLTGLGGASPNVSVPQFSNVPTVLMLSSDFTTANNTNLQAITLGVNGGLLFSIQDTNNNFAFPFSCHILYSQATGAVADQFGIQDTAIAPNNIMAKAQVYTSASAFTAGNLPTLTTTTATAIVTFTPSAMATVFNADIDGFVDAPANASPSTFQIMVQTSNGADAITIKKDSFCRLY